MNEMSPLLEKVAPAIDKSDALPPELAGLLSVFLRLIDQRGPIIVYLGAALHGEGTTTVARKVCTAAARWNWCKVLLVDASKNAGAVGLDGLLEAEELPLRKHSADGVTFMEATLSGATSGTPRLDTVRSLFDRLRKQFTLVVVDSPPILSSNETAAFGAAADCVVLVVEAERTRSDELERARSTLEQLGAHVLGIVLNKRRQWVPGRSTRRF
jgi:Mrp family chromosome partitioning ATPase